MLVLLLLLQLRVPDAAQFVGPPKGTPVSGEALHRETQRVGALLRCPVCQGMSIADSPSEMAVNMKAQVHELLARGYTEEQILDYFEKSYGQFVLLRPKSKILWVLPLVALVLGVAVVAVKIRSLEKPQTTTDQQPATDDPYLARVRDLVGGGKE
jgi:cytochrome c-type biogenesis protein CcmH